METVEQAKRNATELHWLATLITGSRQAACDVTLQALSPADEASVFFSSWMDAWSRRIFIAKALAAVRKDLAQSARRTALKRVKKSEIPPRSWTLDGETTRSDLERALLQIDVFPRAAVLLLVFERLPLNDAVILLDSEPNLVRKALAVGARELTVNLARLQGWKSVVSRSSTNGEGHHVRSTEIAS